MKQSHVRQRLVFLEQLAHMTHGHVRLVFLKLVILERVRSIRQHANFFLHMHTCTPDSLGHLSLCHAYPVSPHLDGSSNYRSVYPNQVHPFDIFIKHCFNFLKIVQL